jgi:hypothetical protein
MKETAFSEADSHSAGQEILRHLWNQKVYQHFHKNHILNHFLGQSNPVCVITSHLFEIHCPTYITFPRVYMYSRFLRRNCGFISRILCASYLSCSPHLLRFHSSRTQIMQLLIMLSSPSSCYSFSLRLKGCPQYPILIYV